MATIAAGNHLEVYVPVACSVTVTPGIGGVVDFGCSSPGGQLAPAGRRIHTATSVDVPSGSTLFLRAEGADAEYSEPIAGAGWSDSTGTALVRPDGGREVLSGLCFRPGVLLGDSLTGQHAAYGAGVPTVGSQGPWNWANWLVGAPFDLDTIYGVSGALAADIFSRTWMIPPTINAVFVVAGTNDVFGVSAVADAATRDAAVTALTGTIAAGLAVLRTAGKTIAIATIPPNNAYTAGDSRIDVLDRVNAYIATTVSLGLADYVMDLFASCWDSAAPTTRVYKTNHNSSADGTHLSNLGAQAAGIDFIAGMQGMYRKSSGASPWIDLALHPLQQYSTMRVISGVSSTISTGGSGTPATDMAGGWRSLRGAGTPTWVCSIVDRTTPANWVGPMSLLGVGEKFQKYVVTAGAAGDTVRTQLVSAIAANTSTGISYGDTIACGADVLIESPSGLNQTMLQAIAYTTAGTSPADQPYGSSLTQYRTTGGINSGGLTDYAYSAGFRAYIRTRRVRIAENVNGTVAVTGQMFMDLVFNAAGSVTAYWGRPQFWRWMA